jgi:hypothetical protein
LSYQVRLRKIANHKHSSSNSTEIQWNISINLKTADLSAVFSCLFKN